VAADPGQQKDLIMRRALTLSLAGAAALGLASAANATVVVPTSDGTCTSPTNDTVPQATACTGYYTGNIFDNNAGDQQAITTALAGFGITYTGDIANYQGFSGLGGATDLSALFGNLIGTQIIGIHYGGGAGGGESAFYQINFGPAPGQPLMLTLPASSNVYRFTSTRAVPEPATWAMMLLGFGGIGMAMRRGRKHNGRLLQVA
jgi:hypothetical protein